MNTYKIIGLENFVAKSSGKLITKIYCVYNKEKVSGLACETFVIMTENVPSDVAVDCKFRPLYGRQGANGFLASLEIVE